MDVGAASLGELSRPPDHRGAIAAAVHREHDDARAVLHALFPSGPVFVMPEVSVGNDQAKLRFGKRHKRAEQTDGVRLSRDDLLDPALVPEHPSVFQLDAALSRLGRLIVGAGRTNDLVLAHPRFGDFVREEWIPASRRREIERRFISWDDRALTDAGGALSSEPSPYLVSHFGAHRARGRDPGPL